MKNFYVTIALIIVHLFVGCFCSVLYIDIQNDSTDNLKGASASSNSHVENTSSPVYSSKNTRDWTAISLEVERLAQHNKVIGAVLGVLGTILIILICLVVCVGFLLFIIPGTFWLFYVTGCLWYLVLSLTFFSIILYKRIKYLRTVY